MESKILIIKPILDGVDFESCDLVVSNLGFCTHINRVTALIKGGGRKALEKICSNADKAKIVLSLNACPVRSGLYPTQLEESRLVGWYESFGFKRHQAPNAMFSYMSNLMVRKWMRRGYGR